MGRLVIFLTAMRRWLSLTVAFALLAGCAWAADTLPAEPEDEVVATDAPPAEPKRVEVQSTKAQPVPRAPLAPQAPVLPKAEPLAPKTEPLAPKAEPLAPKTAKAKLPLTEPVSVAPPIKSSRTVKQATRPAAAEPSADPNTERTESSAEPKTLPVRDDNPGSAVDESASDTPSGDAADPTNNEGDATSELAEPLAPIPAESADGAAAMSVPPTDEKGEVRRRADVDAASFKGVHPGRTTTDDVEREWGAPKQIKKLADGGAEHLYKIDPFDRVSLTVVDNLVTSMSIFLENPLPPEVVAQQLQMDDIEAVTVRDSRGQPLGQAFPERGVLFTFASDGDEPAVSQIVLEPVDPQSFVLRAEQHLTDAYLNSLEDVDYALSLNVQNARAHWVRAQILLNMGDLEAALKAAEQAVTLEPDTAEYRLVLARILARSADFAGATQHLEDILSLKKLSAVLKARTELQLGYCAAHCAKPNYSQALKHHQDAITLAEPLVTDERNAVRHAAKEILIEAHLGVAQDIAAGRWQHKSKVVPKWLDRASAFAEELITHDKGSPELRLRVSEGALAALAILAEPPEAQTWIDTALEVGKQMIDNSGDAAVRQHCQWRLGIALADAMQIEQARHKHEAAIDSAKLALEMLKQGDKYGVQLPSHDFLIGRVLYRLGSIEAVDREDHKRAIAWYDKAVSLLESPLPPSALTDAGRQGETFISMAVSYWEAGGQDEALRLTRQGVQLLEKAVDESLVSREALAIPYGNLSSMHEELGQAKEARKYAELAQKCERTETK